MPLWALAELDVPALIWKLGWNVCPPSVLNVPQYCASVLGRPSVSPEPPCPRSLRESYQVMARFPVLWSSDSFGRNWLFTVLSSFTRLGVLQVAPLLSE